MYADARLARRLEAVDALNTAAYATTMARLYPESGARTLAVGGGYAVFTGSAFPINRAAGLGMTEPVTAGDLDDLEAFFARVGGNVEVDLCPLADGSLLDLLRERAYRLSRFLTVCARPLTEADLAPPSDPGIAIAPVADDDVALWARDADLPAQAADDAWLVLNTVAFHRPGVTCFVARVDGEIAGKGALALCDGVATLFSAHTRPAYRRRGVQAALIRHRLAAAAAAECDLALATARPGSDSQRNLERAGFRVAYTRAILARP